MNYDGYFFSTTLDFLLLLIKRGKGGLIQTHSQMNKEGNRTTIIAYMRKKEIKLREIDIIKGKIMASLGR